MTIEWQGALSVPRVLRSDPRNASRLVSEPLEALTSLRNASNATALSNVPLFADSIVAVASGLQLDLLAVFELLPSEAGSTFEVGVQVAGLINVTLAGDVSHHGELNARLVLRGPPAAPQAAAVEQTELLGYTCSPSCEGAFTIHPDELHLELRVLYDRSIVEAFAHGGRAAASKRVYPAAAIFPSVSLIGVKGEARASIEAFAMKDAVAPSRAELLARSVN
eukprot:CAMPEP_0115886626 /NCGR_PEP_ID=MMETSP0287-20121206/31315_1 /TAXON_ID=412157 /ORGANISM="Chrysochromulina rotalis, Strain UIO044" /LENGTH=221 /DNA_ID=CAMNT_0003343137 /DNA_START=18 /DNA_END=683 /DNA_ORIENTATION=+